MFLKTALDCRYGEENGFPNLQTQSKASLDQIISFGVSSGYKEIVLCGIDLTNTNYFYTEPGFICPDGLTITPTGQNGVVHKTFDRSRNSLPIDQIVKSMNEIIIPRKKVELFVALKNSGLYPMLPSYFE
ncbi:hypothetical protein LA52FAK_09730 [Desulforhopalus sp. 52FAK]